MSENSVCLIPNDTDPEDVVLAIAYLCGIERIENKFNHRGASCRAAWAAINVDTTKTSREYRVFITPTHSMTFFQVCIHPTNLDGEWHTGNLFVFSSDHPGYICIHAGVSRFWQMIDRELVNMFGGKVDNNDCDNIDWDYVKRKPRKNNHPTGGEEWQEFQDDLFNLPRLFDFIDTTNK